LFVAAAAPGAAGHWGLKATARVLRLDRHSTTRTTALGALSAASTPHIAIKVLPASREFTGCVWEVACSGLGRERGGPRTLSILHTVLHTLLHTIILHTLLHALLE
jgi:hypothetical protein